MKLMVYVRKNGRLALFKRKADPVFWRTHWLGYSDKVLRHALRRGGSMASFGRFFAEWLPREGWILEAGCGTGLWVRRFLERGYNTIGMDYALETLLRSKDIAPDLPMLGGDILCLPFRNESLAAYVSFGVVEHIEEGPRNALREVYRVLRPGGVALVSVPYENLWRRKIAAQTEECARDLGLAFYQYYFTHEDFLAELANVGLRPQRVFKGYGVHIGLKGLGRLPRFVLQRLPKPAWWLVLLDMIPGVNRHFAHMMFTVAIKP